MHTEGDFHPPWFNPAMPAREQAVLGPLLAALDTLAFGNCGKPRTGIECRLVDENDLEVPAGQVGELILRSDLPRTLTPGYQGMPEATARAWRTGWFHTGDIFRQDARGALHGAALCAHPGITAQNGHPQDPESRVTPGRYHRRHLGP